MMPRVKGAASRSVLDDPGVPLTIAARSGVLFSHPERGRIERIADSADAHRVAGLRHGGL